MNTACFDWFGDSKGVEKEGEEMEREKGGNNVRNKGEQKNNLKGS